MFVQYKNGNYDVFIDLDTGTKIRKNDLDFFEPDTVESLDIKITNRCDMGCQFCHENSTPYGKHGDILFPCFIDKLHPYTELAIGGGNPLSHPDLIPFLEKLKELKMIPSMTVNQIHFMQNLELMRKLRDEKLIYGLGISLTDAYDNDFIEALKDFPNAIIHVINGIVTVDDLEKLAHKNFKILILGYKEVRRGKTLYNSEIKNVIDLRKNRLSVSLPGIIQNKWFFVVSFDNLAIKQLNPQRFIPEKVWKRMYMGDDGIDGEMTSASMFVDMVERKFAKNSCAAEEERYALLDNIDEMYRFLKQK